MAEKEIAKRDGWLHRLGARWGVSTGRALVILLVFACTGLTVMFLKRPVVAFFTEDEGGTPLLFSILYYILILPFYNAVLLVYGALLGQFDFFWAFEKRFVNRILGRKK